MYPRPSMDSPRMAVRGKTGHECPISSWKRPLILDLDEEDFEPRSKKERKEEKLNMIECFCWHRIFLWSAR